MMSMILKVSASGYQSWKSRKTGKREKVNKELSLLIQHLYEKFERIYGSPKILTLLGNQGWQVNHKRVERLMAKMGLYACFIKKFKPPKTTNSRHGLKVSPNRLKQNFKAEGKNQIWVWDINYVKTMNGFWYLCIIKDLFTRKIVGYSFQNHMKTRLVKDAFMMAIQNQNIKRNKLIFHSDRGSQYASRESRKFLFEKRVYSSLSSSGNCYDNAPAE